MVECVRHSSYFTRKVYIYIYFANYLTSDDPYIVTPEHTPEECGNMYILAVEIEYIHMYLFIQYVYV